MKPLRFQGWGLKRASALLIFAVACSSSQKSAETVALGETEKLEAVAGDDLLGGSTGTESPVETSTVASAVPESIPSALDPASPIPAPLATASSGEVPPQSVPETGVAPSAAEASAQMDHKKAVSSEIPSIAQAPFQQEGFWMNAYYFVRSPNETWVSLSQTFYGRPDRAELLKNWNKKAKLQVGRVIYYNSPSRPDDTTGLHVFSEDFGAPLEKVVVKAGESLSLIGQRRYGHVKTWKEIAVLNPHLTNPDVVSPGQVLKVQPVQIDTKVVLERIVREVSGAQQANTAPTQIDQTALPDQVANAELAEPATTQDEQISNTSAGSSDAVSSPSPNSVEPAVAAAPAPETPQPMDAGEVASSSSMSSSKIMGILGGVLLVIALGLVVSKRLAKIRASKTRVQ